MRGQETFLFAGNNHTELDDRMRHLRDLTGDSDGDKKEGYIDKIRRRIQLMIRSVLSPNNFINEVKLLFTSSKKLKENDKEVQNLRMICIKLGI